MRNIDIQLQLVCETIQIYYSCLVTLTATEYNSHRGGHVHQNVDFGMDYQRKLLQIRAPSSQLARGRSGV